MKIGEYINETREEMRHVSWPTRKQVAGYTGIVIAISVITAAYLGAFDFLINNYLIKNLIG